MRRPLALSLTGSGHLLVYQLGVCRSLLGQGAEIRHVVGASGGAIAAAVAACCRPHQLNDFALQFIQRRGGGISLLREFAERGELKHNNGSITKLHIATTRCSDGKGQLFSLDSSLEESTFNDTLMRCIEASCRIPATFHPYDILSPSSYPEQDGVVLDDGVAHVDGGIATPAPPTPFGENFQRVIVSPVSGSSDPVSRISPDTTARLFLRMRVPHDLGIHLSIANLRTLRTAGGLVSSSELQEWYDRGQQDAGHWWSKDQEASGK